MQLFGYYWIEYIYYFIVQSIILFVINIIKSEWGGTFKNI
jgi:hypothetical protein